MLLVDGGYTGKPFATAVQSLLGASVEVVKRNELHTFVVLPKRMGGGAVFRLAGEVPPPLEELREKAQYQPANGGSRLRGANPEEIVNRLLEPRRVFRPSGSSLSFESRILLVSISPLFCSTFVGVTGVTGGLTTPYARLIYSQIVKPPVTPVTFWSSKADAPFSTLAALPLFARFFPENQGAD